MQACYHCAVDATPQRPQYTPRVFETDATEQQRELYVALCADLAFDPETPVSFESRYQITMSCRCGVLQRADANRLAARLGLYRNALMLTALKLGLAAMDEALEARDES